MRTVKVHVVEWGWTCPWCRHENIEAQSIMPEELECERCHREYDAVEE